MPKAPAQASPWLEQQLEGLDIRWVLVAVLALVAVVYAPTLRYALVYDDGWVLITNGFLREPDLGLLFSPRGVQLHVPDVFRPTSVLFDLLTYRAVGLHAGAHHAISIALHLGVCALGYAFARRIGVRPVLALAATAVFGTMGLHAEVVSLVSYREDMLALGLGLAAMLAASDALRQSDARGPASALVPALAATVLMALAAGAKLSVGGLPLVWALADARTPGLPAMHGRRVAMVGLLFVGVALALWQRSLVLGGIDPYLLADNPRVLASRAGVPFTEILAASAQIHLAYLGQMLLPVGLSPEYTDFHAPWSAPASVLAVVGLTTVAAMAVGSLRRGPALVGLCLVSAAVLAAPTSNLLGMPNMRADRFTYASSLPMALLIAAAALALGQRLARAQRPPWIVLTPLLAVVLVQGSLAIAASSAYQSNRTLWATAIKRAPHSARARAMFGLMRLGTAGHRLRADPKVQARVLADCERAEALDPLDEHVHLCHARLAAALSAWPEARVRLLRAIEIAPDHEGPWIAALAQAELEQLKEPGQQQDPQITAAALARSQAWIDRGLGEYPYLAEVHLVAARLEQRRGNADLARTELGRARSLRPERWETVLALVELELDLGHVPGAYAIWRQEAMVLAGADPVARDHLLRRIRDASRLGLRADPQDPQLPAQPPATNPAP